MSLALQAAKFQGDPGLFSFIGKAVKGVGKVLGKVAKVAASTITGGPLAGIGTAIRESGIIKTPKFSRGGNPTLIPSTLTQMPISQAGQARPGTGMMPGTGIQVSTPLGGISIGRFSPMQLPSGEVVMVPKKGRRINPLNPRALSRSMRRLSGFVRATRTAEKMIQRMARRAGGTRRAQPACGPKCKR